MPERHVTRGSTPKCLRLPIAALLLALVVVVTGALATSSASAGDGHRFERFLERYEAANTAFVNGDPSLWLTIAGQKDPVSIFGGSAAGVRPGPRPSSSATSWLPARSARAVPKVDFDYLVKDVRGRLAYTVAIESAEVLYANQTELQPHLLRVTMIFCFEKGEWRIVHRHADTMTELELPVA